MQPPFEHTGFCESHASGLPHWPSEPHVSVCVLDAHCWTPGAQTPPSPPLLDPESLPESDPLPEPDPLPESALIPESDPLPEPDPLPESALIPESDPLPEPDPLPLLDPEPPPELSLPEPSPDAAALSWKVASVPPSHRDTSSIPATAAHPDSHAAAAITRLRPRVALPRAIRRSPWRRSPWVRRPLAALCLPSAR
jgi:hypothetical protein